MGIRDSQSERSCLSMIQPVHGSAPTIAGQGAAKPMGTVRSAALVLDHPGGRQSSEIVVQAVKRVAATGPRTSILGGIASTTEVSQALNAALGHGDR